ncbi:DUF3789 domain-containing protein [Enterococcus faecalis]|uniref:DUF3789 domain-containing protein n=1 Tax=Enterococcus TaxID=1350 RepID=UPI001A96F3A1|nr:DUF3789 domain-containing protein [Enterococcus faecalis]MBO1125364.1 DUF3789 domain-containing protein [Enterococcus faecalis]
MNLLVGTALFLTGGFIGISIMCMLQVGASSDQLIISDGQNKSKKDSSEPPQK